MNSVIVVGGGILGVSTAIWLQRAGHEVTIVDRAEPRSRTSYGNGGVLAASSIVPVTGPGLLKKAPKMLLNPLQPLFLKWSYLPKVAPWLMKYLKHNNVADTKRIAAALNPILADSYDEHVALSKDTTAAKHVVSSDMLHLYDNKAHFEGDRLTWEIRRENGYEWDEWDHEAIAKYEPVFAGDDGVCIRLKGHGMISDPPQYVEDLTKHFVETGGRFLQGNVSEIIVEDGKAVGVVVDGEKLSSATIALTGGAWSAKLLKKLGLSIPMESERGYHLEFWGANKMPNSPTMISSGKFIATPMKGRLRIAGVVEFGGLEKGPSEAPFAMLKHHILKAIPDLKWEKETKWMGHRPAPSDSIPLIGELPGASGLFVGFGHHHVGLTGGPKTGRLISQLISGQRPNIDMSAYSPSRFL